MMSHLSPPWYTYQKKLAYFFSGDSAVTVSEINTKTHPYSIDINVSENNQAFALRCLLLDEVIFGNVVLKINVYGPTGGLPTAINAAPPLLAEYAFKNNPYFDKIFTYKEVPILERIVFCVFKKDIIQFFNDNLYDYDGNYNAIVAEIAQEICAPYIYGENNPVSYCTKSDREN